MPAAARLAAFVAAALLAGALGWAAGDAIGPAPPDRTDAPHEHTALPSRATAP